MKKQISIFIIITVMLVTGGVGCKGLSEEQQQAVQPIRIDYWTVYGNMGELQKYAAEYKKIRPYVTVNIRQVRYEEFDNLFVSSLADDVGPDVVSMHVRSIGQHRHRLATMPSVVNVHNIYVKGEYVKETVVEPVVQTMPSASGIAREFVSTVADDVIYGEEIYGLPMAVDTLALYYNVDMLDRSGVPEPPTDWQEFMTAVQEVTKFDGAGNIIQSGVAMGTAKNIDNAFDIISLLMMQNGVTMEQRGRVAFANGLERRSENHPTLQAVQFYTDFAKPTKETYTWDKYMENAFDAFVQGKTAFYIGYAFDRARIYARAPQLNIDVVSVPQLNSASPANVANYWVETVVKKSENQDEAWDFVRFLTSRERITSYTEATGMLSPLRSQLSEELANPDKEPFASQLLVAKNWYHGNNFSATEQAFEDLVNGFLEPYGEDERPLERDTGLIVRTSQVVGQTY